MQRDVLSYDDAPRFWSDLNELFAAVSRTRSSVESQRKVELIRKNVLLKLEVDFWASETSEMLMINAPEDRKEMLVSWIDSFDPDDGAIATGVQVLVKPLEESQQEQ